jgi:hypothetical protein
LMTLCFDGQAEREYDCGKTGQDTPLPHRVGTGKIASLQRALTI